jgi:hypothetical protein
VIGIRVFYDAGDYGEDWKPTSKGITMRADLISEIKKGIDKAYEEWLKKDK